ncbi:hypothetical protein KUF71_006369 [Frankliniella fusca]|uniref:Uncharacterized protein n=1 Tax=Frankliniella fusca TaxID=407009 RepID=A0AAE1I3D6_9NEOP|nr:hypothetical protein KUF71_017670 [Frankliniella fusca]KAK3931381.1 hypothetical protein KUF71_006369 [Frankliniella fusca]
MSWEQHINSIIKKIGSLSGVLYRLRHVQDREAIKSVYYGLVQGNLCYIFGFHYRHSSIDLYSSLDIIPIRNIINQLSATFAYLVTNKKRNTQTTFNYNYEVHNYNTRNNDKLRPTTSNSTRYALLKEVVEKQTFPR